MVVYENVKVTAKTLTMLRYRITNGRSAQTDALKLKKDNSDAIKTFLSFLTATVLFA